MNDPANTESDTEIAVLIPCCDEEATIGKVIDDFRQQLPNGGIYVFDNNSIDNSAKIAREHGATVVKEARQGKGFVIESMFARIEADIYVLVDGDDTYSARHVGQLIGPIQAGDADMVVAARLAGHAARSLHPLHLLGNRMVRSLINWIFGANLSDIFSGYRAFSHRIVEQIPIVSKGFELETELTVQCLYYRVKILEVNVPYKERPSGSQSKLKTFRDGFRVLWELFRLFWSFKPLTFFGGLGLLFFALGLIAGSLPIHDYFTDPNHYVRHVPLAILATGLMILSGSCMFLGILLHALNWRFLELHNVLTRRKSRRKGARVNR